MSKRPAYSLLFIKSDLIARADFGSSPRFAPMGFWQQEQTANTRLYYSVEAALQLGGKCGKTVWIIGEPFWTQTLSLPASALHGLSHDQIGKAIGFDVEALTGLSHADSVLGFCRAAPLDESEHLWVTQVPLASRAQIQSAIETAGGTLGGIVHPGGLPIPLQTDFQTGEFSQSWRRVEVWKDVTLCLMGHGSNAHRLSIINGDPAQDVWRANVSRWMAANTADHSEWLGPRGAIAGEPLGEDAKPWEILLPLETKALQEWLSRWLEILTSAARGGGFGGGGFSGGGFGRGEFGGGAGASVPVIVPGRADTLQRRRFAAIAAVLLVCIGACYARYTLLAKQQASLNQEQARLNHQQAEDTRILRALEAPRHEFDDLKFEIKTLQTELTSATAVKDRTPVHPCPDFDLERQRVDKLLAALVRAKNTDLVVDHIALQGAGGMLIEGKCLPNAAVDSFAETLAQLLHNAGWEVSPAQKKPSGEIPAGQFSLRVSSQPLLKKVDLVDPAGSLSAPLAGGEK